jgi:hypothetical protein
MGRGKKKETSPYALGSSQDIQLVLVASLSTIQTLQVHVPGAFVGNLSPAAAQLKPPEDIAGSEVKVEESEGFGSSQEMHLVLAESLSTMQTLHVHVPAAFVGALRPAATQLKPPVGAASFGSSDTVAGTAVVPIVAAESGRGSSHETHLDLEASLSSIQVSHTQEPVACAGGFSPAASQLKPTEAGFAPGANVNAGREEGPATEAALRSLACLNGD